MFSKTRACTVLIFAACALSITTVQLFGQAVNGTLLGTLTDSSGAVVAGAQVTITEVGTGIPHSTQSNASGNYVFPNLPPGSYTVVAEAHGFKKESRPDVRVDVNSSVRVDMVMQPGAVTETVEVTGAVPLLKTDRADVSQNIETQQMEQLPIGGANRNFQSLLSLIPGTVKPHRDHSEFFNAQDTLSTEVNGQSREFNQLAIEGVNDDERTGLLQIYVPPAEAIQTVDVTTSNYAAEFGRAGGAVTNVILKSGTNNFHGSLYEYNRVSALQARTYFQRTSAGPSPIARTTFNYYGGTVGGPIIKDKTFFFFDLLRIDDIRGQFQNTQLATDAFRNGDVTAAITAGKANIYNPFTGNADGTGRQQIVATSAPGVATVQGRNGLVDAFNPACKAAACPNIIPLALMDPIALKILALVPHANLPGLGNNYQQNTQFRKNSTSFDAKIDHNFSQKDRLAFRFSRAVQNPLQQPIFGLAGGPIGFQGPGEQHEQSGALNETHIFSPTLVMETRAGISHYRNVTQTSDHGSTATKDLGIPGANLDAFTSGLTQIEIQNNFGNPFVGYSASQPWDRGETNIDVVNNWTKISGNHTFKWGADIRRLRDDLVQAQTFGPRGHFTFGTGTTNLNGGAGTPTLANNFAAFLIGAPTQVGRDISLVSGSWRETEAFFFGQDTWHATSKLTIDAGLRWELYVPATPSRPGRYSNYDPSINRLVIAGVNGNALNLGRETYYKYFAPRVGVAYRVSEQTVLRAGFGISYEPFTNNQYAFNFPVRQNQGTNQTPNSFALPAFSNGLQGTFANGFPAPTAVVIANDGTVAPSNGDPYNVIDKHFQQPYVESYNFSIQQSLPGSFVMDLAYVGNHGVKIPVGYNVNAATAPAVDATTGKLTNTCTVEPLCVQYLRTASTTFLFKPTVSNYNSLQARLDRKFRGGFLLTTSYTWAKALAYRSDLGADDGGPDSYIDFQRNYSETSRSRRHTFVQSYVYELPFGKNKRFLNSGAASWILGGWGVSGVLTRMSGTPLHFTASGNSLNAPGSTQYPIQIAPFHVLSGIDTNLWFDTSSFCQPSTTPNPTNPNCPVVANGVLGNMRRYQFSGPGFFNLDASVYRNFPIRERVGLEFRAEAFSVTNTPHFSNPSASVTSSTFGRITGTGDQNGGVGDGNRTVELSARLTF